MTAAVISRPTAAFTAPDMPPSVLLLTMTSEEAEALLLADDALTSPITETENTN